MAPDEQIDRLNRQLSRDSLRPVTGIARQALSSLVSALSLLSSWLRQAADDRPLITLLLSLETGYVVARVGRRRAGR